MAIRRQTKSSNTTAKIATVVAVLLGGGLLTYGIARAAGWLNPATAPLAQKPSRAGKVPIPKSLVALNAFDKVQREDVYNLGLGDDSYFWLPKQQVEAHPEWITDVSQIVGRVMARDKRADFVFSEKDFLPEGSRTGIAGGIPSGKQGFFLEAEQIPGLRFLQNGDRFDLLASLPEEAENPSAEYGLLMGGIKARGGKPIPVNGVRSLVQGGEMIALTTNRTMTTRGGLELSTTDSRGREITNRKDERVVIAIDPAEAVPLTQALGSKQTIHMVTRSGQETEQSTSENSLVGMQAFPASAVAIKAFSTITANDLAEPLGGELRQYYFQPGDVKEGWIPAIEQIVGRVVARDIEPGFIFSADDFLTPGSLVRDVAAYQAIEPDDLVGGDQSALVGRVAKTDLLAGQMVLEGDLLEPGSPGGVAAGIPAGLMGMSLSKDQVQGLGEFSRGDRFDLVASASFDLQKALGGGVQLSSTVAVDAAKAVNQIVATAGLIVDVTDESAVVAVSPQEVALITKALASKTALFTIARPALASQSPATQSPPPAAVLVSDPNPLQEVTVTQMLIGGQRSAHAYRKSDQARPLPTGRTE